MNASTRESDVQTALSLLQNIYFNPILRALVQRRVPDCLDRGPLSGSEIAHSAGMNALSVTRVLRALSAFGAFQEVAPGIFANNAVSSLFRDRAGGLRHYVLFMSSDHYVRSAAALSHSAVTGESAMSHVFGESFWEYTRGHPEENETFNRALAELRGDEHRQIADAFDWTGVKVVVDVGGGIGSLLATIMSGRADLRGVLIDQPAVLTDAERVLAARGVLDRCELKPGNFFDAIQAVGDVWMLCQVLHDWPDLECNAILSRCREAMRPTDRLLVAEMVTIPCRPSVRVSQIDMTMLMLFGEARQRTVDEYRKLFASTRFSLARVVPSAGAFSIVEATPA
jgi:hypothetical protein